MQGSEAGLITAEPEEATGGATRTGRATEAEHAGEQADAPGRAQPVPDGAALAPRLAAIDAEAEQRRFLSLELRKVSAEIDSTSTLLPWAVIATGAAMLVTGVTAGSVNAVDCTGSCSTPFWPGWAVTAGATIGIGGLVWLRLKEVELSRLGSRRYQLQRDLEHMDLAGP
jgi:hypothetical protein